MSAKELIELTHTHTNKKWISLVIIQLGQYRMTPVRVYHHYACNNNGPARRNIRDN